jgi:hypothetical protein
MLTDPAEVLAPTFSRLTSAGFFPVKKGIGISL